jgi:GNAT superfamily N-acetyltransferase
LRAAVVNPRNRGPEPSTAIWILSVDEVGETRIGDIARIPGMAAGGWFTMGDSLTQRFPAAQVTVELVNTRALVHQFVEVPYRIYRGDPHWVPPLRRDERRRLSPGRYPFFRHADMVLWLAMDGGRVCGRIAAIEDRLYEELRGERIAWFGFFEAENADTAQLLLTTVEDWARARRLPVVRGPVNPSLNDSGGLLVEGFDLDPYVLMPYNPPAYAGFMEQSGYRKAKDLLAWSLDLSVPLGRRIELVAARTARRHGVTVRTVDLREFDAELATLQTIYREAWQDNWGFVPPTDAEVRLMARELKPILDAELLLFAEIEGRPVACAVAIPDVNQVLKKMGGRLFPFGLPHFLNRRRTITQVRALLVGVLPAYRKTGLYPLLIADIHRRAVARGYTRGEMSWTLEDNVAINAGIEAAGGRRSKTYRIYERSIG